MEEKKSFKSAKKPKTMTLVKKKETLGDMFDSYYKIRLNNEEIGSIEPEWNLETKITPEILKQKEKIRKLKELVNNKIIYITKSFGYNQILSEIDIEFKQTPENYLGHIDKIKIINENNIYFRFFSENTQSILSSIYQIYINTNILWTKRITYDDFLKEYKFTDFDENYCNEDLSLSEKITNIIDNCNKIAGNLNISIILVHDRLITKSDININKRNYMLCSNNSEYPFNKPTILIYYRVNQLKNSCNFEPILSVNFDKSTLQYILSNEESKYFEKIIIEQDKILEPIPDIKYYTVYPYPKGHSKISTLESSIVENESKNQLSDYILFNPNDKDTQLPIIELIYNDTNYKFLLGNKYIENDTEYYNIYENNSLNKLVGKIKFNNEDDLTVYWCKDYSINDS